MIRKGRLYQVPNCSVYVRVLSIHHRSETKIVAKLRFEYKSGMIIETKNYILEPSKIEHWVQV